MLPLRLVDAEAAVGLGRPDEGGDRSDEGAVPLLVERQLPLGPFELRDVDEGQHRAAPLASRVGQDAQEEGPAPAIVHLALDDLAGLEHLFDVLDQPVVLQRVGEGIEAAAHVLGQQVEGLADLGGELADPQLGIEKQRVDVGAFEQVVDVGGQLGQLGDLRLVLGVDRVELLVDRVKLLVGALQLLVRGDELLVGGL